MGSGVREEGEGLLGFLECLKERTVGVRAGGMCCMDGPLLHGCPRLPVIVIQCIHLRMGSLRVGSKNGRQGRA